jgi:hypothetical protein
MNINRNPTLVGLPRAVIEPESEPFPLCKMKRSGVVPVGTIPRDTRGTQGPVPVHIPRPRRVARPDPHQSSSSSWKDAVASASVVFMLGAALIWWAL